MSTPPSAPPQTLCPRCGTPYEPEQEYCLECGLRLPVRTGLIARLGTGWYRRFGWYPGDWVWPSLLGLLIAALGATGAIWLGGNDNKGAHGTVVGTTSTQPVRTQTQPTAPEQTTAPTTTSKPRPKPKPKNALTPWPPHAGWTVVLASVPTSSGRGAAVAQARSALAAGLKSVGVIDSSRFSSLHPGYYVVFSGVYSSEQDANSGAADAHARGYPVAYARRITP